MDTQDAKDLRITPIAKRVEQGFYGILSHIATTKGQNPLRDMMTKVFATGLGILAYPLDRHTYPDPPFGVDSNGAPRKGRATVANREKLRMWKRARARGLPWSVRSVNPLNCLFDVFEDPPTWMIEQRLVNGRVIAEQYGKAADFHNVAESWTGTLVEYCDPECYGVFLNDKPLLDGGNDGFVKNPTGQLWYEFAWSGMGDEHEAGEMVYKMQGLIRQNRAAVDIIITALNVLEAIRRVNAFPTIGFEPINPSNVQPLPEKELEEFKISNSVWVHQYWKQHLLEMPHVPEALIRDFEEGLRLYEMGFGPDVLSGKWRDETASGQLVRLEQARAPLLPGKASGEQAVSNMLEKMADQIKHRMDEPLDRWISGTRERVRLDPRDIDDDMLVTVDFTPPTEQEKVSRYQLLEGKYKAGAISLKRFIAQDDTPIVDVEDEIAEIMADTALKDPEYLKQIMAGAMPPPEDMGPEVDENEPMGNMMPDRNLLEQGGAPPTTQPNGLPGVVTNGAGPMPAMGVGLV